MSAISCIHNFIQAYASLRNQCNRQCLDLSMSILRESHMKSNWLHTDSSGHPEHGFSTSSITSSQIHNFKRGLFSANHSIQEATKKVTIDDRPLMSDQDVRFQYTPSISVSVCHSFSYKSFVTLN